MVSHYSTTVILSYFSVGMADAAKQIQPEPANHTIRHAIQADGTAELNQNSLDRIVHILRRTHPTPLPGSSGLHIAELSTRRSRGGRHTGGDLYRRSSGSFAYRSGRHGPR